MQMRYIYYLFLVLFFQILWLFYHRIYSYKDASAYKDNDGNLFWVVDGSSMGPKEFASLVERNRP